MGEALTVGRVSSAIALGNSAVALSIPLLLSVLIVRHYDSRLSAASWSVVARQLHSTIWPSILRSDSVNGRHVHWSISTIAYLNAGLAFLGLVSGVITPLGLGDEIRPSVDRIVPFEYMPDTSGFGNSTMDRPNMPLSRDCGIESIFCPGAIVPGSIINQSRYDPRPNGSHTATTNIPRNITDMFTSATSNSTVASIFDMQYRSWLPFSSKFFNNGEPYPKGQFRHVQQLVSSDGIVLVEGVIVDMGSGGIGFRNHTAPVGLAHGAEWEEDIMWLEPEISCASTNLSVEMTIADTSNYSASEFKTLEFVDEGGFANLPPGNPYDNWPNLTWSSPNVQHRAHRSAWLSNVLTAMVMNLTDSVSFRYGLNVSRGAHYTLPQGEGLGAQSFWVPLGIRSDYFAGYWLQLPDGIYSADNGSIVTNDGVLEPPEDYPFEQAVALFYYADRWCTGQVNEWSPNEYTNVLCGYVFPSPSRIDGGNTLSEEVGSKWRQPVYSCAGAVKASIKTVSFVLNGTASLGALEVTDCKNKIYSTKKDFPLWAVEDFNYNNESHGASTAPLWGVVGDDMANTPAYNFSRAPEFYLPRAGFGSSSWSTSEFRDMLAGASAPYGVLAEVMPSGFSDFGLSKLPLYNEKTSRVLQARWKALSGTPKEVETIIRLVWTDVMASAMVGTNSPGTTPGAPTARQVRVHERVITYDMRYAIPAIFLLFFWFLLLLAGVVSALLDKHLPSRLKLLLNSTSVGRVATNAAGISTGDSRTTSTKIWAETFGNIDLKLGDTSDVDSLQEPSSTEPGRKPPVSYESLLTTQDQTR